MGSITQAAQNLYMAQPNLSKALRELEKEVGFAIFTRMPNGVKTTDAGAEFLYHARQIIEQLSAVDQIRQRNSDGRICYKISIPRGSYLAGGFTNFVSSLEAPKGMEITIQETNALGTIANVADKGYNVGIIRYQSADEGYFQMCLKNNHLEYETIWEFEYVLVMSKFHPLANKPNLQISDLVGYTKISHGDIQLPHDRYSDKHIEDNIANEIYVYERGSQFDLLTNVPTTYMWVSPIPQAILSKNQLVQRVCRADNNLYKDVMIFRQNYETGKVDELFRKKIYESKKDVAM